MLIVTSRILMLVLLLSGLIKIATLVLGINLNYILIPSLLLICVVTLFVKKKVTFNDAKITFLIYYFLTGVLLLANNCYSDHGYSLLQIFLAILMQSILPILLIMIVSSIAFKDSHDFFYKIVRFLTSANIICFVIYIGAINVDYKAVLNFYLLLAEKNLIVNPLQTSVAGISLRFSGIFNSGFLLASFCCIAISYYFFECQVSKKKFLLIYIILLIMTLSTYNRNGILAYCLCSFFMFIYTYFRRSYTTALTIYFYFLLALLLIIPCVLIYMGSSIFSSVSFGTDQTALTKVSTLVSRIDAWLTVLDINDAKELLFGTGLVQGLGDSMENFYVDNGYLYLLNQGGLLLLIFYLFCWGTVFIKLTKFLNNSSLKADMVIKRDVSLHLLLIVVSMTIAFLNNYFFEPIFQILVFMKCLTFNIKIDNRHES